MSHNFNFLSDSYDFLKISITISAPSVIILISSTFYPIIMTYLIMNFYLFIYFLNQSCFPLIFSPINKNGLPL